MSTEILLNSSILERVENYLCLLYGKKKYDKFKKAIYFLSPISWSYNNSMFSIVTPCLYLVQYVTKAWHVIHMQNFCFPILRRKRSEALMKQQKEKKEVLIFYSPITFVLIFLKNLNVSKNL